MHAEDDSKKSQSDTSFMPMAILLRIAPLRYSAQRLLIRYCQGSASEALQDWTSEALSKSCDDNTNIDIENLANKNVVIA